MSLQLNLTEDVVARKQEDSKGYLRLLLCPKLKASISLCKVREMEPTHPEILLCLRYLDTSVNLLPSFIQHEEGSLMEASLFLLYIL